MLAWVAVAAVASVPVAARADDPHVGAQAATRVPDVPAAQLTSDDVAADLEPRVERLVRQLGSPRYTLRRAAANELRQIGPAAFDQLYGATDDTDPEIAASARYLLQQIPIHWTHSDDSPQVRRTMRGYGNRADEDRLLVVEVLSRLSDGQGIAALCRIARFERSPLVSRTAALAIIRPDEQSDEATDVDPDVVPRELGRSTRVASVWLRQWLLQQRDPAASLSGWRRLIDEETTRLSRSSNQTSGQIVLGLLWNMVGLYHRLGQPQPMMDTIDRMVLLETNDPQQTTIDLVEWFVDHQTWDALDQFLARHQGQLERAKRPLYAAALARLREGKPQLAEQMAARAAKLDTVEPLGNLRMALELYVRDRFEWSVREYHNAIDNRPDNAADVMPARVYLADMLHDHEQDDQAAEALEPLVTKFKDKGGTGDRYDRVRLFTIRSDDWKLPPLPERESLVARYHYYLGCHAIGQQDWAKAREELQAAIDGDETDADVLIAMYRVPEADEAWRAQVRKRIKSLSHLFQQQIDDAPSDEEIAIACNQWAWLVANTEGDYDKAVAYSRRSLELIPGTASFLDTLGRCCFAAGDIDQAIKYQRQAIEKMPYLQVMKRQLATFERAKAKQAAKDGK